MKQNYCKSEYSESWLCDGIVHQVVSPEVKGVTLPIALQLIEDRKFAMRGIASDAKVLVTVNNAISVDREAKRYYAENDPYEGIVAVAMLTNNYIARIVGNLVFMFDKQPVPFSFFNDEAKAIHWLNTFHSVD